MGVFMHMGRRKERERQSIRTGLLPPFHSQSCLFYTRSYKLASLSLMLTLLACLQCIPLTSSVAISSPLIFHSVLSKHTNGRRTVDGLNVEEERCWKCSMREDCCVFFAFIFSSAFSNFHSLLFERQELWNRNVERLRILLSYALIT